MPQQDLCRLAIGQIPSLRADVPHNLELIEASARQATEAGADLVVFPELAVNGYLADPRYAETAVKLESPEMDRLREISREIDLVTGFIEETPNALFYNSSVHLSKGEILHRHRKIYLPTYRCFDERRYFGAGWEVAAYDTDHMRTAMLVCGDAWHLPLPYMAAHDGADILLILAASSEQGLSDTTPCRDAWQWMCRSYALTLSCFVVFANLADGEEDEYSFWGGSFVAGPNGHFLAQAQTFKPDLVVCDLDRKALREQRIKLPFRRDDSLAHTVHLGKHILARKIALDRLPTQQDGGIEPAPKPK